MSKPKFDPSQPYEEFKPKFDPSQPFEASEEQESEDISSLEAGARAGLQGFTSGLSEEILAGGEAGVKALFGKDKLEDFVLNYEKYRDEQRAREKAAREEHPDLYTGAELAGGIAQGIALPGAKAMSLGKMALTGAGLGALSGFGYSEGETLADVGTDTALGAGVGAVAAPVLGKLLPAGLKAVAKSPVVGSTIVGSAIGAGTELASGGDLENIGESAVTGGLTAGSLALGAKGLSKTLPFIGKEVSEFLQDTPVVKVVRDMLSLQAKGLKADTAQGRDVINKTVEEVMSMIPDETSEAMQKALRIKNKILAKSKPQDVSDELNSLLTTLEKESNLEKIDRKKLTSLVGDLQEMGKMSADEIATSTSNQTNKFDELSKRFQEKIAPSAAKMDDVVNAIEARNPTLDVEDDFIKILDPKKALTNIEQSQIDNVRLNVSRSLGVSLDDLKEETVRNVSPTKVRDAIKGLNRFIRQTKLQEESRKFLEETIKKLENTLFKYADNTEKALYKQGDIELGTLGALQELTDIKANYGYDTGKFTKDIAKSEKDLLKTLDPSLSSTDIFNKEMDKVKEIHPDLVDFIKNDLIPTVKQHSEISDDAYQFVKQSQVKSPEEILVLMNRLKEFKPESSTLKKQKEDVIKRLNDKLLVSLKEREKAALSKIEQQIPTIQRVADLTGAKLDEAGNVINKGSVTKNILSKTAEVKGLKKIEPDIDEAIGLLPQVTKNAPFIKSEIDDAQKARRTAEFFAQAASTRAGFREKFITTAQVKAVDIINKSPTALKWVNDASRSNEPVEQVLTKLYELPKSQTANDFINKLKLIATKEGQSRKALLYTLSQRPEYRNLIKELLDDEKEK